MSSHSSFQQYVHDNWPRNPAGGVAGTRNRSSVPMEVTSSDSENLRRLEIIASNFPADMSRSMQHNPRYPPPTAATNAVPAGRFVSKSLNEMIPGRYQPYSRNENKFKTPQAPKSSASKFIPLPKKTNNSETRAKIKDENIPVAPSIPTRTVLLTGTVDHVIRWTKTMKNCINLPPVIVFFQAVGVLDNYYSRDMTKILFIRSNTVGVLQGIFYQIDYDIPEITFGSTVSVIGRMVGSNKMRVETASPVSPHEMPTVHKMAFKCQRIVDEITKAVEQCDRII